MTICERLRWQSVQGRARRRGVDEFARMSRRRRGDGTTRRCHERGHWREVPHDATGRYTSVFDDAGRVKSVVNPAGKRITYSYDAASQRSRMIEAGA